MVTGEFDRVRALLVSETGIRSSKVTVSASLVEDLRIDGDDLADFMHSYFEQLSVDQTGFDADRYLPDEGFSLFGRARKTQPITVAMLVEGLRLGKWPTN